MSGFKNAYGEIKKLVKNFQEQLNLFSDPAYSVSELRKEFIERFFCALGWDIHDTQETPPYRQQVRVCNYGRDNLSRLQRNPDYAFYLPPDFKNPRFLLEVKKPPGELKTAFNYFQTIRYGWNAGTGVSVLTDFKEFHLLDCRMAPAPEHIFRGNHQIFSYIDYQDEILFGKIYDLFSPEGIAAGNLDRYISSLPSPWGGSKKIFPGGGPGEPERSLLKYVDLVEKKLERIFLKNGGSPAKDQISGWAQKTANRLLVIRFLQDRGIDQAFFDAERGEPGSSWEDLIRKCRELESKYPLAVFKQEAFEDIVLDGESRGLFNSLFSDFFDPNSAYLFNYIPVSVLAGSYERSHGKIRVSATASPVSVQNAGLRKTMGVYYTPKFIAGFIIENTVGKLIEGKSPGEIARLRIADLSCGAGSLLTAVAGFLFDYHVFYYNKNPRQAEMDHCPQKNGRYGLSIGQRQNIIRNNLYGVDIDPKAVEVTILSLFLLSLGDEWNPGSIEEEAAFHPGFIGTLRTHIVPGNSLIPSSVSKSFIESAGNKEKSSRLFFKSLFPDMPEPCFDAIIGNPPYGAALSQTERKDLLRVFPYGCTDTAALFLLRSSQLLRQAGWYGLIVPKAFTYASNWEKIRKTLLPDLVKLVDCSRVWKEVRLEMSIFIGNKDADNGSYDSYLREKESFIEKGSMLKAHCETFHFIVNGVSGFELETALRIKKFNRGLNDFVTNKRGGMLQHAIKDQGELRILGGKQISRYGLSRAPRGYLAQANLADSRSLVQEGNILVQNIVAHIDNPVAHIAIIATVPGQETRLAILDTVNQLYNHSELSSYFILGILNSRLIGWYTHKFIFGNSTRTMHFDSATTRRIPFPDLDLKNDRDKAIHDDLSGLVRQRLALKRTRPECSDDQDGTALAAKKAVLENGIEKRVARIYGLDMADLDKLIGFLEIN